MEKWSSFFQLLENELSSKMKNEILTADSFFLKVRF